ncbi:MAG: carboxypeptidase regulatory-like domain-containing protein, partial [Planctomycetes bacterium]|nr:carboxypeptidase regulatory-like domain-containing protein [Planctomycetota bacterium]
MPARREVAADPGAVPDATLRVRVIRAEDGSPVAGARVALLDPGIGATTSASPPDEEAFWNGLLETALSRGLATGAGQATDGSLDAIGGSGERAHAVTGSLGVATFEDAPAGPLRIEVDATQSALVSSTLLGPDRGGLHEVFVRAAGSIVGRVVDPAGRPLPGARVLLLQNPAFSSMTRDEMPCARPPFYDPSNFVGATTGADGGFVLRGVLPGGDRGVDVLHPAYPPLQRQNVAVEAFAETDVGTLVLESGASLHVRVCGPPPSLPLRWTIKSENGSAFGAVRAGFADVAPGEHAIDGLAAGSLVLTLDVAGFAPARIRVEDLGAGEHRAVDADLQAGVSLRGAVRSLAGAPVPAAKVVLRMPAASRGAPRGAETDASGAFLLEGLPEGPCTVDVSAAGYLPATSNLVLPSAPIDVELAPGARVAGVVFRPDGTSVAACRVECRSPVSSSRRPAFQHPILFDRREVVETDASGGFFFEGLHPGRVTVIACADDDAMATTLPLDVAAGATRADLVLRLAPPFTCEGIVVDARDGTPILGARVGIASGARDPREEEAETEFSALFGAAPLGDGPKTISAADGSFRLL